MATLLVRSAEQRSRIAHAQKLLHSAVAALDVVRIYALESRREERDCDKAHALCTQAEEVLGDLMMEHAQPCGTCDHEFAEHDDEDSADLEDVHYPCKHGGCPCPDYIDPDDVENTPPGGNDGRAE